MTNEAAEALPRRLLSNFLIVVALVMLLVVLAVVGLRLADSIANDASDALVPKAVRTEIEQADCAKLQELENRYVPNADSVPADSRAMLLVRERQADLHCPTSD